MQVGKQYPVIGKDYFYRIVTIGEKKVTYITVENVINPDTGNIVNIRGVELDAWILGFDKRVVIQ